MSDLPAFSSQVTDRLVLLEDAIDNIDYPGESAVEWIAKAKAHAAVLAEWASESVALSNGLYRVVQALGFDMDGARNASEFFGPMTYCTEGDRFTHPSDIAVAFATDHRKEMEAEADRYEAELSLLRATDVPVRSVCGAPCHYGGISASRKFSRSELGWMGHCNRRVKNAGDLCFQHVGAEGKS